MKIRRISTMLVFGFMLAVLLVPSVQATPAVPVSSSMLEIDFETYNLGSIHNQDGWSSSGTQFDHKVASNTYGYPSFGTKSLRISNAVTSGSFGDQTFSKSLSYEAGETSAQNGGMSTGPRQRTFEAQWDFASTVPSAEQVGLSLTASPDRGDGARMSWIRMYDAPTGLGVEFSDYQRAIDPTCTNPDVFVYTTIAEGLDRTQVHTIKVSMIFVDGIANDVVKVYIDGVLKHTGTSWEDYFRDCEGNPTRTVDSILFRTGGTAAPATLGKGFVIDNLMLKTGDGMQCTTDCYVDAVNGNDAQGGASLADAKKTIQAAINQVSAGGTVHVAAGTYTESPLINKSLTLVSISGRDQTIIQLKRGTTYMGSLSIAASNVTVDGFTIKGYDYDANNQWASTNILLAPAINMITIQNNRLLVSETGPGSNGDDGVGILTTFDTTGAYVDRLTVTNNLFEPLNQLGVRAFYVNTGTDKFIFTNNQIKGWFYYSAGTEALNSLIDSNVITHTGLITEASGLLVYGSPTLNPARHATISNNSISGVRSGVTIYESENVTVTNNFFHNNNYGVSIYYPTANTYDTVKINYNSFVGNLTAAVTNTSDLGVVNAEYNWWNSPSGPTHVTNPNGTGEVVSDNVDFTPWLCRGDDTSPAVGFQPNLSTCPNFVYIPIVLNSSN